MQDLRTNKLVMIDPLFGETLQDQGERAGIPKEHQGAVFVKGEVVTVKGMEFVIQEVRAARMVLHPKKK